MFKRISVFSCIALFVTLHISIAMAETNLPNMPNLNSGKAIEAGSDAGSVKLPPGFDNPSYLWAQEICGPILFIVLLLFFLLKSYRARTLTLGTLIFISTTTMFWQEFYADWGGYLLYNPNFALIPWGSTMWTAPNKAWVTIVQYGPFFTAIYMLLLKLIDKTYKRFPGLGRIGSILIVGVPIFYLFDLIVEANSIQLGWWTYAEHIGPVMSLEKGTFPIVYPILLFVLYGVVTLLVLCLRGPDGRVRFESWFGVERISTGWRRELARAGSWVVVMNGLFLLFCTGPVVAVRVLFGNASALVP